MEVACEFCQRMTMIDVQRAETAIENITQQSPTAVNAMAGKATVAGDFVQILQSLRESVIEASESPLVDAERLASPSLDLASPSLDLASPSLDLASPSLDLASPSLDLANPSLDLASPSLDLASPSLDLAIVEIDLPADTLPVDTEASSPKEEQSGLPDPMASLAPDQPSVDELLQQLAMTFNTPAVMGSDDAKNKITLADAESDDVALLHPKPAIADKLHVINGKENPATLAVIATELTQPNILAGQNASANVQPLAATSIDSGAVAATASTLQQLNSTMVTTAHIAVPQLRSELQRSPTRAVAFTEQPSTSAAGALQSMLPANVESSMAESVDTSLSNTSNALSASNNVAVVANTVAGIARVESKPLAGDSNATTIGLVGGHAIEPLSAPTAPTAALYPLRAGSVELALLNQQPSSELVASLEAAQISTQAGESKPRQTATHDVVRQLQGETHESLPVTEPTQLAKPAALNPLHSVNTPLADVGVLNTPLNSPVSQPVSLALGVERQFDVSLLQNGARLNDLNTNLVSQPQLRQPAGNSIGQSVNWMIDQGISRATVQLHPAELGSMTIKVESNGEQLSVNILASQLATREQLELTLPRLREQFVQQGFSQVSLDVSTQRDSQQQSSFSQRDQQPESQSQAQIPEAMQSPVNSVAEQVTPRPLGVVSLVDMFA